jgi:GTP-binding protein HflX
MHLAPPRFQSTVSLPFDAGRRRAWLFAQGVVESEIQGEDGFTITVNWTARQQKAFRDL